MKILVIVLHGFSRLFGKLTPSGDLCLIKWSMVFAISDLIFTISEDKEIKLDLNDDKTALILWILCSPFDMRIIDISSGDHQL